MYNSWHRESVKKKSPDLVDLVQDFRAGKYDEKIIQFALDGAVQNKDDFRKYDEYSSYLLYLKTRVTGKGFLQKLINHDVMGEILAPFDKTSEESGVGDVEQHAGDEDEVKVEAMEAERIHVLKSLQFQTFD